MRGFVIEKKKKKYCWFDYSIGYARISPAASTVIVHRTMSYSRGFTVCKKYTRLNLCGQRVATAEVVIVDMVGHHVTA